MNAGTLVVGGSGTDSGRLRVAAGAGLNFPGGTRDLGAASDMTGAGALTVSGATVNANVARLRRRAALERQHGGGRRCVR